MSYGTLHRYATDGDKDIQRMAAADSFWHLCYRHKWKIDHRNFNQIGAIMKKEQVHIIGVMV